MKNFRKIFLVFSIFLFVNPVLAITTGEDNCNLYVKQIQSTENNSDCFNQDRGCGLQQAINIALNNGMDDVVCIKEGEYTLSQRIRIIGNSSENNSLVLMGLGNGAVFKGENGSSLMLIDMCLWNGQGCSLDLRNATITVKNIVFKDASYHLSGGALRVFSNTTPVYIKQSKFLNNSSQRHGGAVLVWSKAGNIYIENCEFKNNQTTSYGGGALLWSEKGKITVKGSFFVKNSSRYGGGLFAYSMYGAVDISDTEFKENFSSIRGGGFEAYSLGNDIWIKHSSILSNTSNGHGGGAIVWGKTGNITLDSNTFKENKSQTNGGGLFLWTEKGDFYINGNLFFKNEAQYSGGGAYIYTYSVGKTVLTNNVFSEDKSYQYDGGNCFIYSKDGNVYLTNNTLYGGYSNNSSGRLLLWIPGGNSKAYIYNNIFWQGSSNQNMDVGIIKSSTTTVRLYNNILSCNIPYGTNVCLALTNTDNYYHGDNFSEDPLFSQPPADLHILANSPAIDKGLNSAPYLPEKDKDGNPRIYGERVDIGAYEYVGEGSDETQTYGGKLYIFPKKYLFGFVEVGESKDGKVYLINTGDSILQINEVSISGDSFQIVENICQSAVLYKGDFCYIKISFSPSNIGLKKGNLKIKSSDPEKPETNIPLEGVGLSQNAPDISLSTTSVDFGTVPVSTTSERSISILNNGFDNLYIYQIVVRGKDAGMFDIDTNCINKSLPLGESCNITVKFSPSSTGLKTGELVIYSNDPDDFKVEITLKGEGV